VGTLNPTIPANLAEAARHQGREDWLATLPATLRELEDRWSILIAEPYQPGGQTAWVAPVTSADGEELVLKVAWHHPEARHESDGLRVWDGQGAVRLHRAADVDADTAALLVERCHPGTTLSDRPELEQDVVIARILTRLWRPPPEPVSFRPLSVMCDEWADEFETKAADGRSAVDPGLAREGMAALRSLPRSAERQALLCTDLHAGNVLAAARQPWLMIDPKPYVGDPTYDVLQHMLNCEERLGVDPGHFAARMAELAGLNARRLRLWLFARCVQDSPDQPELAAVAARVAP